MLRSGAVAASFQPTSPAPSRRGRSTAAASGGEGRSQRERLTDAVIHLSAREGSQAVTVAQISSQAGVSSATFYEQFENKEDCLLAAYRAAAQRLLVYAPPSDADGDWAAAACGILRELATALREDPDAGRLLFVDTLAGGRGVRETRAAALAAFERRVQEFIDSAPLGGHTLDVPATALIGATRSIVARYLRTHGEGELPGLAQDGVAWVLSYGVPSGRRRWSTGPGALLPAPASAERTRPRPAPRRLPRGRHGLPPGVVARSHRTRILYGTAEVMAAKGYANATVADIVAAAGVSREVFYEHFSDKQKAFLEAQNHPTQHILDRCASAYFAADEWPRRVWNVHQALLAMIAESPALSHLRLVECYAAGPEAIRRAEEITRAFTIFLEEGYRYRPEAEALPKLCTQAIAGGVFEMIQRHVARADLDTLPRLLPALTYVCVAPFMGAEHAIGFLKRQIGEQRTVAP
jgi:AcrR family transcriptional regulator